jgi:hypothetical protein
MFFLININPYKKKVVIATPAIHLAAAKAMFRPDIAVSAEDVGFKKGYGTSSFSLFIPTSADHFVSMTRRVHGRNVRRDAG